MCVATSVSAQTSASLSGVVTAGGARLPGVTVTIASASMQGSRSCTTGNTGAYSFATLPPGDYRIRFERSGYAAAQSEATLRLAQTSRIDASLDIARESERVTVRASAPSVLESSQVSTSLTLKQVERLPLQRNQLATAQFVPGATDHTFTNGQIQISGGPGYDNLVLVNGVVVTENTRGQIRPMYVEDAIQETTVLTGAISAEYGGFSGGVVTTITKSGGNDTSASLRDSLSSPSWSVVSPAGEARQNAINQVWEGTAGGSVIADRLWFFSAGRWARNDTARQTAGIPSFDKPVSAATQPVSYAEGNDQKRWEEKLTALAGSQQTIAVSYFGIRTEGTNVRSSNNFYDLDSLSSRTDPESLFAINYDAIGRKNLFVQAHYSARRFSDRSGALTTDSIAGTPLFDRSNNNARLHSPAQCAVCDAERRNNEEMHVDAHTLFGSIGVHDLVAGVARFTEKRYLADHQSGSDFSLFVTRVQSSNAVVYPIVTPSTANGGGTFIRWTPILMAARPDALRTDSLYMNDIWSPAARWQLSIGARWDRNHARNADGTPASDNGRVSPRLSLQYDVRGDGRQNASASYGVYTSRIADAIASSGQAAGSAAAIDFAYRGPSINDKALNTPLDDVIRMVLDWFNTVQGGTTNRSADNLRPSGSRSIPGYASYFDGSLSSPYVREWTAGYGAALGRNGYVRADVIDRDWHDFYAASVTTATRHADTPLGIPVDLTLIRNSSGLERHYRGLQLQARWTAGPLNTGIHYTLSTLRGNDDGESANGATANIDPSLYYPEFFAYRQAAAIGSLPGDERHRLRAWGGYEVPLGGVRLAATLMHSFDSGLPYSIVAPINLTRYSGAPANPGYASIPNGRYFFSSRGALRTDGIHSTDLALRATLRLARLEWFAQADVLNLFNRAGVADPNRLNTSVATAATSSAFVPFDPKKTTPVECPRGAAASVCAAMGANYQLAPAFGQPLNNLAYQTPRTWRISLGSRF